MITVGQKIPAITIKQLTDAGMIDVRTDELLGQGKVVLFAVPGAFTPTCSAKHLPSFVEHHADFTTKGISQIFCMAVNDPFVMKHWLAHNNATAAILPLADGNGHFTAALGLGMDGSAYGLGQRCQRFAMVIENGVLQTLHVEQPGKFDVSSGPAILATL